MEMDKRAMEKLESLNNPKVIEYVNEAIELCKPEKVTVITDSSEDINYVRELAIRNGEERNLKLEGHTIHYDSSKDQARDKTHTRYLLSKEVDWGMDINYIMKDEGVPEASSAGTFRCADMTPVMPRSARNRKGKLSNLSIRSFG